MRYSKSFTKTTKEAPKDAELISHQYLLRGGFVTPLSAGMYTYLPLGFRVLTKIRQIIVEELNKIGVEDILMPVVQTARVWRDSGRFDEVGPELWRIKNRKKEDFVLSMTHEEAVTDVAKQIIKSYKDLPKLVGQIQTKVRDEARVRGGLLRLKEFTMQDAYSFDKDEKGLDKIYKEFIKAYEIIFKRIGVDAVMIDSDTGAMGGSGANEFMMIAESGEDKIIEIDYKNKKTYMNAEIIFGDEKSKSMSEKEVETGATPWLVAHDMDGAKVKVMKGIEVGNIFKLGTKYSVTQKLMYVDENNKQKPVVMGSYGIGLDRTLASVIEASHDDRGMIWPESIAPYKVHLIHLGDDADVIDAATKIYEDLWEAGVEVFYDDREASAGAKFADADLIGIPYRLTVSKKTLDKDSAEIKQRSSEKASNIKLSQVVRTLSK